MFGKTLGDTNLPDCAIKAYEPSEARLTKSQWENLSAAESAEIQRLETLQTILKSLQEAVENIADPYRISALSDAYKNVRGY